MSNNVKTAGAGAVPAAAAATPAAAPAATPAAAAPAATPGATPAAAAPAATPAAAAPAATPGAAAAAGGAPSLILGTAGHIDHGKSTLVQALTGTDPDRLAEEKRRGITIELGFAQLVLPSGRTMGVVDVPGHEAFVRHMVAGATGVDVALIVIAANDGVMPQTVEHLAVLELLGVHAAVVALTKIDMVDADWLEFITDEVASHLALTPFTGAPIVGVSAKTGEGLDQLKAAIDSAAASAVRTKPAAGVRMPVDRVFTVKGAGTVVTGTLWSGQVAVDDALCVLPSGRRTRVRSVQMHGRSYACAPAGNRVALALADLSTSDIRPGDFLAAPDQARTTDRFDAEFTYLDPFSLGRPLKSGALVHVAHGTKEVLGRILFMNGVAELKSGAAAFAQVRLNEPLPVAYRDRFVVRSYSPTHVIGGGIVLTPHPRRRTTLKPEEETMLAALGQGNAAAAVGAHLEMALLPETLEEVAYACGLDAPVVGECLSALVDGASAARLGAAGKFYARPSLVQKLAAAIERALLEFHSANPQKTGLAKEDLRRRALPAAAPACFDAVLEVAISKGQAAQVAGEVCQPRASAGARKAEADAAEKLSQALRAADGMPPDFDEIAQRMKIDAAVARKAMAQLVRDGRAVRVSVNRYYDAAVIERYKAAIAQCIGAGGPATAAQLKEAMQTTRKYAMPLLEYFDACGFTRRDGDLRSLAKPLR